MNKRAVGVVIAALVFAAGVMTAVALADPGNGHGVNNGDTDPTVSCQPGYGGDPCIHNGNSSPGTAKGHGNCEDNQGKGNNGNDNGNDRLPCATSTVQTTTTSPATSTAATTTTLRTTSTLATTTVASAGTTSGGTTITSAATTTTAATSTTSAPFAPPGSKKPGHKAATNGAAVTPPTSPKTSGVLATHTPSQLAFTP